MENGTLFSANLYELYNTGICSNQTEPTYTEAHEHQSRRHGQLKILIN